MTTDYRVFESAHNHAHRISENSMLIDVKANRHLQRLVEISYVIGIIFIVFSLIICN